MNPWKSDVKSCVETSRLEAIELQRGQPSWVDTDGEDWIRRVSGGKCRRWDLMNDHLEESGAKFCFNAPVAMTYLWFHNLMNDHLALNPYWRWVPICEEHALERPDDTVIWVHR